MKNLAVRRPGLVVVLLVASAAAATGAAPVRQLPPVDEAARCPGFVEFRATLREIIGRRNSAALLEIVDPNVRISFGDDNGRDAFRTMWLTDPPAGRDIWTDLSRVLGLGGRCKEADSFVAPYVFTDWPGDLDAFEHAAVTGSRVRLRQAPRETAPVVSSLTFALVRAGAGDLQSEWVRVDTLDGQRGFVARRFVRSSVDLRAFFSRRNGVWRLVTLVSGD